MLFLMDKKQSFLIHYVDHYTQSVLTLAVSQKRLRAKKVTTR